jgi:hypothetical protein
MRIRCGRGYSRCRVVQSAVCHIEDVIKDKHLLIVPSGALTQLPFQVLITEKPDAAAAPHGSSEHTRGPCFHPFLRSRRCAN